MPLPGLDQEPLVQVPVSVRPPTGREMAVICTVKKTTMTYRAGRSRYSPDELVAAVRKARQASFTIGHLDPLRPPMRVMKARRRRFLKKLRKAVRQGKATVE